MLALNLPGDCYIIIFLTDSITVIMNVCKHEQNNTQMLLIFIYIDIWVLLFENAKKKYNA